MVVQRLTWGQGRQQIAAKEAVAWLDETRPVGPLNGPGPTGLDSRKAGARRYRYVDGVGCHIKNPNGGYKYFQFMSLTFAAARPVHPLIPPRPIASAGHALQRLCGRLQSALG